jgi:hypothetical protein
MNYLLFMFLIVLIALILMFVLPMAKSEEIELGGTGIELPDIPMSEVFSRQSIENPKNPEYHINFKTGLPYSPLETDRNVWVNNTENTGENFQWRLNRGERLRGAANKVNLPLENLFYIEDMHSNSKTRKGFTNLKTGEVFKFPTILNKHLTKV